MKDIKSEIVEELQNEMDKMAREVVQNADTLVEVHEVVVKANIELTDRALTLLGIVGGVEMAKQEIRDEFDRNLADYNNPRRVLLESGAVEERKHAAQEACRIMGRIDSDEREKMIEELREAGA